MGRLIAQFDQTKFLSDVMDVEGWGSALHNGSCTAISAYFIKLALDGCDLNAIGQRFENNKAAIAELQQEGNDLHRVNFTGYDHVLARIGLKWLGNEYNDPMNNFSRGNCCLCLLEFAGSAHTLAILWHQAQDVIYSFDPNQGVYESTPNSWYQTEFHGFITGYQNITKTTFKNVQKL